MIREIRSFALAPIVEGVCAGLKRRVTFVVNGKFVEARLEDQKPSSDRWVTQAIIPIPSEDCAEAIREAWDVAARPTT